MRCRPRLYCKEAYQKYKEAVSIFEKIDSFLDSKAQIVICNNNINYSNAINLLIKGEKLDEAKDIFVSLGEFKDSKNKLDECNRNINLNKIKPSSLFFF